MGEESFKEEIDYKLGEEKREAERAQALREEHDRQVKPGTTIAKRYKADEAMFEAEEMPVTGEGQVEPKVYLLSATNDPLGAIAAACMMYEGNVCRWLGDVTDEERRHYWEQVQKTHLKAPLEFVDLHFMIEGVTRSFTHQMVRQRTAVYAQESLRFAVKEYINDEVPVPPSLRDSPTGRELWKTVVDSIDHGYRALIDAGTPAEDARGLLPHSITTRLNYKTNLRNLLDHAGNRLCTQAQFEWRAVIIEIVREIRAVDRYTYVHPATDTEEVPDIGSVLVKEGDGYIAGSSGWQFELMATSNVFKPVCFALGHCPFTAVFDRQCSIRERVQAGEFDRIHPAEYMADPSAGRRD